MAKKAIKNTSAQAADPNTDLDRYLNAFGLGLRAFAEERDWDQYHTPRNLAIAVFSEAGELASEFRWTETPNKSRVADELADVFIFTCILAGRMGIDLAVASRDKVARNANRYPALDSRRGSDNGSQDHLSSAAVSMPAATRNSARAVSSQSGTAPLTALERHRLRRASLNKKGGVK